MDKFLRLPQVAEKLGVASYENIVVSETGSIRRRVGETISSCSLPCLLHITVFTHRGEDYWKALKRYGYPAPLGRFGKGTRWCCGVFKHRVFQRLAYNGFYNNTPWKYGVDGVKATDSPYRRKKYTSDIITWEKTRDTYLFPLRTLSDSEVWMLLEEAGLKNIVEKQYEKWGRSPNCMFCPMLGRITTIRRTVEAMPDALKTMLYRELVRLLPRYKPTTYSYKSIEKWIQVLEEHLGEKDLPESRAAPHRASCKT